ncbi:MAG TPA: hypothetical protein VFJ19_17775 [Nocardioidaceae bacterium]|nr:hypothetical protein [Nocardioidaceae bacterium]
MRRSEAAPRIPPDGVALGVVPVDGRGSLPFTLLRGEPLVTLASRTLQAAGVALLDDDVPWASVRRAGAALVVLDPLCPATPTGFAREVLRIADSRGRVAVGVRPVTDTLKATRRGPASPASSVTLVGGTVDRATLLAVCSPLVLPTSVVTELAEWPDLSDLAALVDMLKASRPVEHVHAPASARRVADASDVRLLEALNWPSGTAARRARGPRGT